ncbi:MAG: hypothetical protein ABFS23_09720 [Pseudomonadota bacterium]
MNLGFIAGPLATNTQDYRVGDAFLSLLTFLGCSPHVELEPPADGMDNFTHVRLHRLERSALVSGSNTRPPHCASCRKPVVNDIGDLPPVLDAAAPRALVCRHCHRHQPVAGVRWRRDGGYGRSFIEVRGVFPGEAVPVDSLLQSLATLAGCPWRYFYLLEPFKGFDQAATEK